MHLQHQGQRATCSIDRKVNNRTLVIFDYALLARSIEFCMGHGLPRITSCTNERVSADNMLPVIAMNHLHKP